MPEGPAIRAFPGGKPFAGTGLEGPLHLALGMFDGVHRGHQVVIRSACEAADQGGGTSAVLTFDPHPSRVLYPERATRLLIPVEERVQQMLRMGVDHVFIQNFTKAFAGRSAETFAAYLKTRFPALESLHVGRNFRFGHRRQGDVELLQLIGATAGFRVQVMEREVDDGDPISSSRIRKGLEAGLLSEANRLLGYAYFAHGRVSEGNRIGRGLGFPTANVPWQPEVRPRFGVYQVLARFAANPGDPSWRRGIANYGLRPTVESGDADKSLPLLELHLLDEGPFPEPGDEVQVAFLDFIREERRFASLDALQKQIAEDVEKVRKRRFPEHPEA